MKPTSGPFARTEDCRTRSDLAAGTIIDGTPVPGRTVRRVRTTLEMKPGQSCLLGGLVEHTETVRSVPLLNLFPVVGPILSKWPIHEDRETVILVTPTLLRPDTATGVPAVRPTMKTEEQENASRLTEEARKRLRRMERRLKQLQKHVENLDKQLDRESPAGVKETKTRDR